MKSGLETPERSEKIIEEIRTRYTLEEEFRVLRQAMARLFIELGAILSEQDLEKLNRSREMKDFWSYHDFVEQAFEQFPDAFEEQEMESNMESLGEEIVNDLLRADE